MERERRYFVIKLTDAAKYLTPSQIIGLREMDEPTHVVQSRKRTGYRPHITKAEREHTPPELAKWLAELAASCKGHNDQHNRPASAGPG